MLIHTQHSIQVESERFKTDPSKSYEFSVWMWSEGGNNYGTDYLGLTAFNSEGNPVTITAFDIYNVNSNGDDGNPYFWYRSHGSMPRVKRVS